MSLDESFLLLNFHCARSVPEQCDFTASGSISLRPAYLGPQVAPGVLRQLHALQVSTGNRELFYRGSN